MTHQLLRVPEVATQLGISRAKVYELMAAGRIPSVKIDGCRRVRSSDLDTYIGALPTVALTPTQG